MRWLVTGGYGFMGGNVVRALQGSGLAEEITLYDNASVGQLSDLDWVTGGGAKAAGGRTAPRIQTVTANILDARALDEAMAGMDVVIHLAANTGVPVSVANPVLDFESNARGTFACLEAARRHRVGRFVFASSSAPIGEAEPPIHEEMPCHPISPYGASKLAGEGYCSAYHAAFGLDTVALRFSNAYGPASHRKGSVVAHFIKRILAAQPLEVFGDGHQIRDFIYVDDIAQALLKAATVPGVGGEVFQVATNVQTSVNDLIAVLQSVCRAEGLAATEVRYQGRRVGDIVRTYSDISKARERLAWEPAYRIEEGLRETVRWFVANRDKLAD